MSSLKIPKVAVHGYFKKQSLKYRKILPSQRRYLKNTWAREIQYLSQSLSEDYRHFSEYLLLLRSIRRCLEAATIGFLQKSFS